MDLTRLIPRPHQAAVFFFAAIVLLSETVLFHCTHFVVGYVLAMTVIGCAVAGIGLGSLLASRLRCAEVNIFGWCCGGTTGSLYLVAWVLLRQPQLLFLLPATATVFVFPSMYIARSFARRDARSVYFYDMLGAGTAVGVTVALYRYCGSEAIFLGLVTLLPLLGAAWSGIVALSGDRRRAIDCLWLLLLGSVGALLLYRHLDDGALNIARLVNSDAPGIPAQSVLRRQSRLRIAKTYDNLLGRIDAIPADDRTYVTYNGFFNDNFYNTPVYDYAKYAQPHQLPFPEPDRRVVCGLVPEPKVFVVGAAADGILKTLRAITPLENIDANEINPGILQLMQHDFIDQSGRVYEGLHVQQGNALAILKRQVKKYDIITLINTHSSRWIGVPGPPDYLHTRESYDLYLDSLTPDGYLLFEERPDTWQGELGLKRMILTLYDCLQRRGVEDPAEHFFIWEFMSNRYFEQGGQGIQTGSDMYYVGMVVSLQPLRGPRRQHLLDWCDLQWKVAWKADGRPEHELMDWRLEPAYLKGQWHGERFGPFLDMIPEGDFTKLDPQFDATPVTNDRPFPSCSQRQLPEIQRMVRITSAACLLLGMLIVATAARRQKKLDRLAYLLVYNILIGAAYFFVEIMLIQAYQEVFLSPTSSLVLVLGVLLVGSGIGGLAAQHITPLRATLLLCPLVYVALRAPGWILSLQLSSPMTSILAATVILLVGMNMGIYFPNGLLLARRWSLRNRIPHLFALNSLAGSWAAVLSFYLGIRVGYTWTLAIALILYALAAMLHGRIVARLSES